MVLTGYHHLTAITDDLRASHDLMTRVLGMRLVKRAVNEDGGGWHLFYGDGAGTPGATISFFHWTSAREQRGTSSIVRIGLRVPPASLDFWAARLTDSGAIVRAQRVGSWDTLACDTDAGLRLSLIADGPGPAGAVHHATDVPPDCQIRGLGGVALSVHDGVNSEWFLTAMLGMQPVGEWDGAADGGRVMAFAMPAAPPGPAGQVHVLVQPDLAPARQGPGAVHHLAFCTPDDAGGLGFRQRLLSHGFHIGPQIDRRYFKSVYCREPGGNLLEIATQGPGFTVDEPLDQLGRNLKLPPEMDHQRAALLVAFPQLDEGGTGNRARSGS
ncbi:MAG: VOC family protein [Paracoccus sp. (in: a-proteobacteria)]|nr:VOC family protein [Paracoccus sp. (in: a-proteobacteria)]